MRLGKARGEDDSSSKRGNGDRVGVRSRKKHKRLDAISEDVFNRNREGKVGVECVGNDDSELRRSSRVRKAPEVLDSSPHPKRRRRRQVKEKVGRGGGYRGLRGKGKKGKGESSSEEEMGSWKSRSRRKEKGNGKKSRGKRKLFEEDLRSVKGSSEEKETSVEGEKSEDEDDSKADSKEGSSEEESGSWKSRLRTKEKGNGKRKLVEDVEEDSSEEKETSMDGEKSGDEEDSKDGSSEEESGSWKSRLRKKEKGNGKKSRGKRKLPEEDEEDSRSMKDSSEEKETSVDDEKSGDEEDSKEVSSEEELGSWKSRLRTKEKGKGKKSRGETKLFEDGEEGEEDDEDGDKSGDEEDTKVDSAGGSTENEVEDDHSEEERVASGEDDSGNEKVGDCTTSMIQSVDVTEEIEEDGHGMKERGVLADTMVEEKVGRNEHIVEISQPDKAVNSSELVEDAETQCPVMEVDPLPTDITENGNNDITKDTHVGEEVQHRELENSLKVKNNSIATDGKPRQRIKEGRRCGLCGGGTDGKPPKKLVTDSGGSDQEAYSGSSGSEEFTYDPWDGFGDESGWLGKLLGPVNDRLGIARIWVHQHCAVWSPEVYFAGLGCLKNIRAALCRGRTLKCTRCGRPGATLGCRVDRCPRTYHMPCARASGCHFDHRKFLIACADHRYLFEPHGHHYSQHIKKLKAKKMKFEVRKLSNDALRKDVEAEEKWMEKCGEDEEFLRRETKRLQRDLTRIAPVYIGGPHSEGENPAGGWESVAGLQNVVQCMKEVVILPLLYPEFYENMGITPPRGVLLHGYPGTGKTLVVRSLIGSCARGNKRIAYFARKGADCLGKYVGDAERQLRLLFQVAEKSQPSIIFFDEIDGLAPVRTRHQDQTHSSVVSTLLALMDGLKSRGSVIVIGATNRPDSVDPALRRPGRFDREIYFPLPSVKDRAAILALHTRKWPKPVSGPLLEWVATKTIGFAGADLQALCAQVAVIALKRNCSWHKVLSSAAENPVKGRRPKLPSFEVEERDWLEALSLSPPPCSRREAGMAANEVLGTPLDIHLIPCLLQPLLSLIISLYLDDRLWLPLCLVAAGKAIKKAVVSQMEEKNLKNGKWTCLAQHMAQDPDFARVLVRNLINVGIVKGDASLTGFDITKDASFDDSEINRDNPSGMHRNLRHAPFKNTGYRIMISGAPRCGQKHLASCLLHCFLGNLEIQKIDLATISQEGHGDIEQGILRILLKCASLRMCVIFMPRIDFWAIESHSQTLEQDVEVSPVREISTPRASESAGISDSEDEICYVSKTWKLFREQLECLCVSSSLIILATSEIPYAALPSEICQFFGGQLLASEGSCPIAHGTPQFSVEVNGELDQNELIHLSAVDLSRNLIQQFVHVAHMGSHQHSDSSTVQENHLEDKKDTFAPHTCLDSFEDPGASEKTFEDSVTKLQVPADYKNVKEKSTLVTAVNTFGYQILRYPHFAELCWATSKLKEGPSADVRGPWKGWPFNSCIIRPCQQLQKDVAASNSSNINGKDKFTLVRGLIAVGLSAYRGVYKSSREVSLEVRKVLKLLVGQISARIKAGKDRFRYTRLLSQVAYLEDMVNNWSHSLRSLEPEDQTLVTSCNHSDASSPEIEQTIAVSPMGVEEKPNTDGNGGIEVTAAVNSGDIDLNAPAVGIQGDGFEMAELVEVGSQKSLAESSQLSDLPSKANNFGVDNQTDFEITDEIFSEKAVDVSDDTEISPDKAAHISVDNQTDFELTDEMSLEKPENHWNDVRLPGSNLSCETSELPSKLEVLCSYTCCPGCVSTLQELVKKTIIQVTDLSAPICTVEDIHDHVSSLSTNLCSAVRNLYIPGESRNPISNTLNSGTLRNLDSREPLSCQCVSSESSLTKLMDCVCHLEKYVPEESKSSSYDQPRLSSRYIFRDGVLVPAIPEEEYSFHCKYDMLCLCSLIKLIVRTKVAVD